MVVEIVNSPCEELADSSVILDYSCIDRNRIDRRDVHRRELIDVRRSLHAS